MITLENVSKVYSGQSTPAVNHLTLEIPEGHIVMLIGPSGCGKTTTLKMMNRLIEPTCGRIIMNGKDVTEVNADALRRRIGYVIQQGGLFPHFTIAENIAVVPQMLGWDRSRIKARVDELLGLMDMEPREFSDRYPRQLSGGQKQRVGVARALAADPPVMLMDEPFGALDSITRERLQEWFLTLQEQIAKTICFVTHDIDEAIRLGNLIAILGPGGRLEQYDTPGEVLAHPATDAVSKLVGGGGAVRRLRLLRLEQLDLDEVFVARERDVTRDRLVLDVDSSGRPKKWLSVPELAEPPSLATVPQAGSVHDAMDVMLGQNTPIVVVVNEQGPVGALRWSTLSELRMSDL